MKEYKDKVCRENAWGKVIEKLGFYDEGFNCVLFPQKLLHRFLMGS